MVQNVQPLIVLLTDIAQIDFEIKILKDEEVKIQRKTDEKYSLITKALIDRKTEFHSMLSYRVYIIRPQLMLSKTNLIILVLKQSTYQM